MTKPRQIRVEPISRRAFVPFGDVIDLASIKPDSVNDGTAQIWMDLARIDVGRKRGRPRFTIVRAAATPFPLRVAKMERHPLGSQAFWPLDDAELLVVVAPAGRLDPWRIRAFRCPPRTGINYRPGVWHHPLIAMHRDSAFVVIDRAGPDTNFELVELAQSLTIASPKPARQRPAEQKTARR